MNITFVVNSLSRGGAERSLSELANYWAEKGQQVHILTLAGKSDEGAAFELYKDIQLTHLDLGTKGLSLLSKMFSVPRLLKKLRVAVLATKPERVVSFMDQSNILCSLALRSNKVPLLLCERVHPAHASIFTTSKIFVCHSCSTQSSSTTMAAVTETLSAVPCCSVVDRRAGLVTSIE